MHEPRADAALTLRPDAFKAGEIVPKEEFDEEHLPGAINIPLRRIDEEARERLDPSRPVVVYCWDDD